MPPPRCSPYCRRRWPSTGPTGTHRPPSPTSVRTDVLGNPVITYVAEDGTAESSIDSLAGPNRTQDAHGPALPRLDAGAVTVRDGRPFTVGSTKGDTRCRSIAVPRVTRTALVGDPGGNGGAAGAA
ncbi:hypothetical protein [Streptomyces sp. NPDC002845]